MSDKHDIVRFDDKESVMKFLQSSTLEIAEALSGILASEKRDKKLFAGRIIQSVIKGQLLTQLGREIEKFRNEAKIKEDYLATARNRASFYELLKFIDEEVPDEELFTAVKSIFFSGVSTDATQQDEALAYEFLQTAKKLSGTEILILKANSEIAQNKISPEVTKIYNNPQALSNERRVWRGVIATQMGYGKLDAVVFKYEPHLESLGLISPRQELNHLQSYFDQTEKFRLTAMGYKFCEFITKYK